MPEFKMSVIAKTNTPQTLVYKAMRTCHHAGRLSDWNNTYSEEKCGELVVKHLLAGNRGHFGCFEHPSISISCENFPHSVMQQIRTHRVGASFDVQSFRFCSSHIIDCATKIRGGESEEVVEEVIYIRPVGRYACKGEAMFNYTEADRLRDIHQAAEAVVYYADSVGKGCPAEQARALLPFDYRQNWVASFNARSLMHILDLRHKADAQLEAQKFSTLLFDIFEEWMPQVSEWYKSKRLGKALLAP